MTDEEKDLEEARHLAKQPAYEHQLVAVAIRALERVEAELEFVLANDIRATIASQARMIAIDRDRWMDQAGEYKLYLVRSVAEKDAIQKQLKEALEELNLTQHAASVHADEHRKARNELADDRAELVACVAEIEALNKAAIVTRETLERIATCDFENGEDIDDIQQWARAALEK